MTGVAERLQAGWQRQQAGEVAEAEAIYREVLEAEPTNSDAWCYLGLALYDQRQLEGSADAYRRAIDLRPHFPVAWNNLGNALRRLGRVKDSIAALRQALAQKPDYASAHNNLGVSLLLDGQYAAGWPEYEWRRRCFGATEPNYAQPRWDGTPLAGRTLLLYAEQGLGDTIQFARYGAEIQRTGGRVIVWCQRPLIPILRTYPGIDQLMTHGDPLPPFDTHASLLSVPGLLGTDSTTIPAEIPYLSADPDLQERWKARLAGDRTDASAPEAGPRQPDTQWHLEPSGIVRQAAGLPISRRDWLPRCPLRVGIAWQGNPDHPADADRSIPLAAFEPLARTAGVTLFSLQKGFGREQIEAVGGRVPLVDLGSELDERTGPFLDTAAVMRNLDLVITSDTSVAHLAGALAVPVWVVLSAAPDWRWLLEREDSPWYPTMRLFRQTVLGRWDDVFDRIATELGRAAAQPQRPVPTGRKIHQIDPRTKTISTVPSPAPIAMPNIAQALAQAWQTHQAGNIAAAEAAYRQAVAAEPTNANAWCYLGIACHDQDKFTEAEAAYREAIRLLPNFPIALNNLGNTLRRLERIDESLACFARAIEWKPDYLNAFKNAGTTLVWEGRLEEAVERYRSALRLSPNDAESHRNVGIIRLLQGDFQDGWTEYEWRWKADDLKRPDYPQPLWQGELLAGKTILLYAEQGLGDTLHFVRYAQVLKKQGATTVVQVQTPLLPILRTMSGIDRLISQRDTLPAFDTHASLLSVPAILRTDLSSIPADVPYVFAEPRLIDFWRAELDAVPGFRVGIVWQGNPDHQADHLRSVPLSRFQPLADIPGVRLFSLQKGHGIEQLASTGVELNVVDLGTRLDETSGAFLDSAAVMKNLDLVITTDTSIVHLAGALGVPTWLALAHVPDWRWLLQREDSPWYPSMRLFRQPKPGDWDSVFGRLADELRTRVAEAGENRQTEKVSAAASLASGETGGLATESESGTSEPATVPDTASPGGEAAEPAAVDESPMSQPIASAPPATASAGTLGRHTSLAGFNDLVRGRYGLVLYNRHDLYIGRSLNLYGEFSEGEVDIFRALLKPGDVVLEAGANIGAHTLPLSQIVGKNGVVLAFEPQRILFQVLCGNMALNSVLNVHCHQQALGDVAGRVMVPPLDYTSENNFGGLGLGRYDRGEPVPLVMIDALALSRCTLLKVDVEGMEQQVLRGARQTIERHRPLLYVENDRPELARALIDQIRSYGYKMYWHTPPLFNPRNYFGNQENVFGDTVSINMLAIHTSVPANIQGLRPVD